MKAYYHLSEYIIKDSILTPRVPSNFFSANGYEDTEVPRVCLAPSIQTALMALSYKWANKVLYVYTPAKWYQIYTPSIKQVPDVEITKEVWVKELVTLVCLGKIKVLGDKGKNGFKFMYGNHTAELYEWDWEWLEKYNKKRDDRGKC